MKNESRKKENGRRDAVREAEEGTCKGLCPDKKEGRGREKQGCVRGRRKKRCVETEAEEEEDGKRNSEEGMTRIEEMKGLKEKEGKYDLWKVR